MDVEDALILVAGVIGLAWLHGRRAAAPAGSVAQPGAAPTGSVLGPTYPGPLGGAGLDPSGNSDTDRFGSAPAKTYQLNLYDLQGRRLFWTDHRITPDGLEFVQPGWTITYPGGLFGLGARRYTVLDADNLRDEATPSVVRGTLEFVG